MGHVTAACRTLAAAQAAEVAPDAVRHRWEAFLQTRLDPLLALLDSPLVSAPSIRPSPSASSPPIRFLTAHFAVAGRRVPFGYVIRGEGIPFDNK